MKRIIFSNLAYTKMVALVSSNSTEVAWYGVVERRNEDEFYVKDTLVYPQIVEAAFWELDDIEHQYWKNSFDDEIFNNLRLQGHSHVNMATMPSITDENFQENTIQMIENPNDYYIFIIVNKSMDIYVRLYDVNTDKNYYGDEVDVQVELSPGELVDDFLNEASKMIKRRHELKDFSAQYGFTKTTKTPRKNRKTEISQEQKEISDSDAIIDDYIERMIRYARGGCDYEFE